MHILIDSADIHAIERAMATGYVHGVTTNPTLLERARVKIEEVPALARQILKLGAHELHLQVYSADAKSMVAEAAQLAALDPMRVCVKIPATPVGYAAAAQLAAQGVRVTLTAVYTVAQTILAQSVNACYIAVYLGRMRDDRLDALGRVGQMQRTLSAQQADVGILAASIRAPAEVEQIAELGIRAATLPLSVLEQLPASAGTAAAAAAFDKAVQSLR